MAHRKVLRASTAVLAATLLSGATFAAASTPDLSGRWYGHGAVDGLGGGTIQIDFSDGSFGPMARLNIPVLGLADVVLPAMVDQRPEGPAVIIGVPGFLQMSGLVNADTIVGALELNYGGAVLSGTWYAEKDSGEPVYPGAAPGPDCVAIPPAFCSGTASFCSELVPFEPEEGPGYLNYPVNGESWDNQYRSFISRDLLQLVSSAAARVACKGSNWEYGTLAPLGLGDMSEADGATPGTSTGYLGHPVGTHEHGRDIDIAYYQRFAVDNLLRPVGVHQIGPFQDALHLVGPPYALDVWRTALFIAVLSEHPRVRVIGVDGKIGPVLEDALDELVATGWIDFELRQSIPLVYEEADQGWGFFLFHHHHMHVGTDSPYDLLAEAKITPRTLKGTSNGPFISLHIEPEQGLDAAGIDPHSVALVLEGSSLLYPEPGSARIDDFNDNGIADLELKFDRQAVVDRVGRGEVEISIVGRLDDLNFQAVDLIRVID